MRTLESLRDTCIDADSDTVYDKTVIFPGAIANTTSIINIETVLKPGRYVISSTNVYNFDNQSKYDNAIDGYKVWYKYRIGPSDDEYYTKLVTASEGGKVYNPNNTQTTTSIKINTNQVVKFDIEQNPLNTNNGSLWFFSTCSRTNINSSFRIEVVKLF